MTKDNGENVLLYIVPRVIIDNLYKMHSYKKGWENDKTYTNAILGHELELFLYIQQGLEIKPFIPHENITNENAEDIKNIKNTTSIIFADLIYCPLLLNDKTSKPFPVTFGCKNRVLTFFHCVPLFI